MTTLYHGSNVAVREVDLSRCKPFKDFGRGFYLTDIREQAQQMALRRVRITGEGVPVVTAYAFDEACLHKAIASYQGRQRRFGKTEAQVENNG